MAGTTLTNPKQDDRMYGSHFFGNFLKTKLQLVRLGVGDGGGG